MRCCHCCWCSASVLLGHVLGRYDIDMLDVWRILLHNVVPPQPAMDRGRGQCRRAGAPAAHSRCRSDRGGACGLRHGLQGMFRNPLVDPGVIGVTSGAAFGGTLAILLVGGGYIALGSAFAFGIASLFVVRLLASMRGRTSILTLVLAGVIVSAFFEAAISIIKLLADPHEKLPAITYWLMGSIASTSYSDLRCSRSPSSQGWWSSSCCASRSTSSRSAKTRRARSAHPSSWCNG